MRARLTRRRGTGDDGTVIVEACFLLPIIIFIVMAIFEYGLLFAAQSTTQSATKEGVRFASANYAVAGSNQAAADAIAAEVAKDLLNVNTGYDTPLKLYVYKADTNGDPLGGDGFNTCSQSCWRYTWNGSGWTSDPGSPKWLNPSACVVVDSSNPNAGINTLDSIGTYVQLRHAYVTGAFGSSQLIQEHTVSRLEPLPSGQC